MENLASSRMVSNGRSSSLLSNMAGNKLITMPSRAILVALVGMAMIVSNVQAFKDPHNVFCGKDDCYELLGLKRGAEKAEIKKAYRDISKEVHPDKNQSPEAHERFTKVAKAYKVFMDDKLNEQYHFFLDHPDAYWVEYGHHWVMRYAAASDVRHVLLGLLALVSFFVYGVQHTRYTTAVQYLRKAAEKNLGPKQGGTAATMQLRKEAEALLAQRKGEHLGKKNGSDVRGSKVKQSRKEKEAELAEIIAELSLQVDIKGSCRKPSWDDQPVVILAMLPYHTAMYLWHKAQLLKAGLLKLEVDKAERIYWARTRVGMNTWEGLDDEAREAAVEGDAWRCREALYEWKQQYLYGNVPSSSSSSKGLRKRKGSVKGGPVDGNLMKDILGVGPTVEY